MKPMNPKNCRWAILAMLACSGLVSFGTLTIAGVKIEADNSPVEQTNAPVDLAKLEADIGLSPEQKTKLDALIKDQNARRRAFRDDTSMTDEAKKAKSKAIIEATRGKIKALLTEEQFAKWQNFDNARRAAKAPAAGESKK